MSGHTPTPWRRETPEPCCLFIVAPDGRRIADVWMDDATTELHHVNYADAALIVRAVNAHDALVTALERAYLEKDSADLSATVLAALKLARGEA